MTNKGFKIETERLILRAHCMDDIDRCVLMNQNPEVAEFVGYGMTFTRESMKKLLEETTFADYKKYGYGRLAVVDKTNNLFIGFSGLKYIPELDEVELGYRFFREYWGKGIATEAGKASIQFGKEHLGLKRIIGLVNPDNIASIRVLEKLGFQYEKNVLYIDEEADLYALEIK